MDTKTDFQAFGAAARVLWPVSRLGMLYVPPMERQQAQPSRPAFPAK